MKEAFILYILLIFLILLLVMAAQKLRVASPLLLVAGGLLLSWIPALSHIQIDPELIFLIFLPPLLYEAAWSTSWKEMWRWRRVIIVFAILIVILTSGVVALVAWAWIPGFTLALGFLLGGIVSPPDAISATSVMHLVRVPRRLTHILEGESLLNDASSLIIYRFALAAVDTGRFIFRDALGSFLLVIIMGVATGVIVGLVYYAILRWLPTNPEIDIVLSLTAPYVMYLAAEAYHFSGVLAVVSGSLFLSTRSFQILSHRSRIRGSNVWSTIGFVLNGLIFMLIGLELPEIIRLLGNVSLAQATIYGLGITLLLIIARFLCTMGASVFTVFISRFITTADSRPGWKAPLLIGWAGMRGVVSLAAALSIPFTLSTGAAFPQRDLILFITFVVIVITLLVQGLSMPWVIRRVNMKDPDHELSPEEQDLEVRKQLTEFGLAFLDQHYSANVSANPLLRQLRSRLCTDNEQLQRQSHEVQVEYKKIYLKVLKEQRRFLLRLNKSLLNDEDIIRKYQQILDLEQEKLMCLYEGNW
ncbi:MAG TPA: Na+/H+ antiporter [Puia sp.]|jgi:Na+/H+ antiporter|nr:Na+/H+ antiporter [Puia sp.]